MTTFPESDVAVTLTGEEWTTILARIARPGGLSSHGQGVYRRAAQKLSRQLLAASERLPSSPSEIEARDELTLARASEQAAQRDELRSRGE